MAIIYLTQYADLAPSSDLTYCGILSLEWGIKDMSLAVALEGSDGVVLAVDSRGTIGDPRGLTAINDTHEKLYRITKWSGICIFGAAEIGVELVRRINDAITSTAAAEAYVDKIEEKVRATARKEYASWFSTLPVENRPGLGLMLSGITTAKRPRTVLFGSGLDFAPQVAVAGLMLGGVPQYAIYLSHRFFDRTQPVPKLANLAEYLISETATQDPKVGGPIKIALITVDNGYKDLTTEEVLAIHTRNLKQSQVLKENFYKADENATTNS